MIGASATLAAAGFGIALGIVTGMPLGVVNVSVIDAALAGRTRFAIGVGVGGAIADSVHAGLAFAGIGRVVAERPGWEPALAVAAAAIIVAYAIVAWRARTRPVAAARLRGGGSGVIAGVLLTLPNPGALAAWVAVAGATWPTIAIADALVLAAGVGIGSAAWFAALARWSSRVRADHPARRYVPQVALGLLVALAGYGVVRAIA